MLNFDAFKKVKPVASGLDLSAFEANPTYGEWGTSGQMMSGIIPEPLLKEPIDRSKWMRPVEGKSEWTPPVEPVEPGKEYISEYSGSFPSVKEKESKDFIARFLQRNIPEGWKERYKGMYNFLVKEPRMSEEYKRQVLKNEGAEALTKLEEEENLSRVKEISLARGRQKRFNIQLSEAKKEDPETFEIEKGYKEPEGFISPFIEELQYSWDTLAQIGLSSMLEASARNLGLSDDAVLWAERFANKQVIDLMKKPELLPGEDLIPLLQGGWCFGSSDRTRECI